MKFHAKIYACCLSCLFGFLRRFAVSSFQLFSSTLARAMVVISGKSYELEKQLKIGYSEK